MKKIIAIIFLSVIPFLSLKSSNLFAQATEELGIEDERFFHENKQAAQISGIEKQAKAKNSGMFAKKEVKYLAGKDNQWFTQDDIIYQYYLVEYDSKGRMIKKKCFVPGPDNIAFTSDDKLQNYSIYKYGTKRSSITEFHYNCVGDGQGTMEDYYSVYEHKHSGKYTKAVRYSPKGRIMLYAIYEYDPRGEVVKDVEYKGPGPDNQWFTSDDEIEKYHRRQYDNQGKLIWVTEYDAEHEGRGSDGRWFTRDDKISASREFFYDTKGLISKTHKYIGEGQDKKWFDDDDVMQYYTLRYYTLGPSFKGIGRPIL